MNLKKLLKFLLLFLFLFVVSSHFAFSHDDEDSGLGIMQTQSLSFGTFAAESGGTVRANGVITGTVFNFGGQQYGVFVVTKTGNTSNSQKIRVTILDPIQTITRSGGANMSTSYQIVSPAPSGTDKTTVDTTLQSGSRTITITGLVNVAGSQTSGTYNGTFQVEAIKR